MLEISKVWNTSSSSLFPGPLWPGAIVPVSVSNMGQINLYKTIHIRLNPVQKKKNLKKQHEKCKYEHTINMILQHLGIKQRGCQVIKINKS